MYGLCKQLNLIAAYLLKNNYWSIRNSNQIGKNSLQHSTFTIKIVI